MLPKILCLGPSEASQALIFLHGGPGLGHEYFLPYTEDLTRDFFCVFYTQGETGANNFSGLLDELDAVVMLCRQHKKKVVLFGHSFGGALALEYIRQHSDKNLSALIGCAWNYSMVQLIRYRKELATKRISRQRELPLGYDDKHYRDSVLRALKYYFTPAKQEEGREVLAKCHYNSKLAHNLSHGFFDHYDGTETLHGLSLPTLCLYGAEDRAIPARYIRHGLKKNSNIVAHEIKDAGHFPFVEHPQEVCGVVRDFLKHLPGNHD